MVQFVFQIWWLEPMEGMLFPSNHPALLNLTDGHTTVSTRVQALVSWTPDSQATMLSANFSNVCACLDYGMNGCLIQRLFSFQGHFSLEPEFSTPLAQL